MIEINTFSSAVDDTIIRSGRPDRKADIIAFVRTSIRECQVQAFFRNDMVEDTLTADGEVFIWSYPQDFRFLRTVRYPFTNNKGQHIYPDEKLPGRNQRDEDYFYYGGPGYYAFAGLAANLTIDVAYYKSSKKLPFYEKEERPAIFDLKSDSWKYLTASDDVAKLVAREAVSNWVLFNYYDTVVEGALAKLFKTLGDERSRSTFALYKSLQSTMLANEPSDSLNK